MRLWGSEDLDLGLAAWPDDGQVFVEFYGPREWYEMPIEDIVLPDDCGPGSERDDYGISWAKAYGPCVAPRPPRQ